MASKKFLIDLDLNKNQIKNVVAEGLGSDPESGVAGQYYYNTSDNSFRYYNGSNWIALKTATVYSAESLATDQGAFNQYAIYDSTSGSTFKFRAIKGGKKITMSQSGGVITINLDTLNISDITGLDTALAGKVDNTTTVAGKALSGNVDLEKLTVGSKSYDGASAVTITAEDLGLSAALTLKGRKDTYAEVEELDDMKVGDVWLVGTSEAPELEEYVYTSELKWEKLGITTKTDLSDYYKKSEIEGIKVNPGSGLSGGGAIGSGLATTIDHKTNTPTNDKGDNDFVSGLEFDAYGHPTSVTYGKLPETPDVTVTETGGDGKVMTNLTPSGHELTPTYKNENELKVAGFASQKTIQLTGAITGSTSADFSQPTITINTSLGTGAVRRVATELTGKDTHTIEIQTSGMKEVSIIKTYLKEGNTYTEVELDVSIDTTTSQSPVITISGNNISALTILAVIIGV